KMMKEKDVIDYFIKNKSLIYTFLIYLKMN
ncbi:invasion protein, partial [Campylobacter jejuni]|nr:invasion protein [Campylobacter jejuni]